MNKLFPLLLFILTLSLGAGALFFAVPRDLANPPTNVRPTPSSASLAFASPNASLLPLPSGFATEVKESALPLTFSPSPPDASFLPAAAQGESVKVVIFDDFLCPHCESNFFENLLPFIKAAGSTADLTFYTLPTKGQASENLGKAAYCAEEAGKGMEFREALYGAERKVASEARVIADRLEFDLAEYDLCLNSLEAASRLEEAQQLAIDEDIIAVPTVLIGSERLSGAVPQENLLYLLKKNIAEMQ